MTLVESIFYKKNTCCVVNKREPFTDVKNQTKELAGKKDFQTNTEGGEKLWDSDLQEFDKVCKERLGKSFGEVISLVPEAGLTKKESPVNAKKKL